MSHRLVVLGMRHLSLLVPAAIGLGLLACQPESKTTPPAENSSSVAVSSETLLVTEGRSASFAPVTAHLDLGGEAFSYQEQVRLAPLINELLKIGEPLIEQELNEDIDLPRVFAASGFDRITATGSSTALKGDFYESRGFWHVPGEKSGLLGLFGQEAQETLSATYLPAGADLVIEQEIDLAQALRVTREIGKGLPKSIRAQLDEALDLQLSPAATLKAMLTNLNLRLMVAVDADPEGFEKTSDFDQHLEGIVVLKNAKVIWDNFKDVPQQMELEFEERKGLQVIVSPEAVPGINTVPILAYDPAKQTLLLATSEAYLDLCLGESKRLTEHADYLAAMGPFAEQNNAMGYASPYAFEVLQSYQDLEQLGSLGATELKLLEEFIALLKPMGNQGKGTAYAVQVLPDGILFATRGAGQPLQVPSVAALAAAGSVPLLFISSRAWVEGSNKAKCVVNMSSIQKAAVSYANLNQIAPEDYHKITMQDLVDANMIPASLGCPSGGNYILKPTKNQDDVWVSCDCDEEGHELDLR